MTDFPEFAHLKLAEMLEILACPQSRSNKFRARLAKAIGQRTRQPVPVPPRPPKRLRTGSADLDAAERHGGAIGRHG